MCLVVLALDQSRRFPLVLASNRDEFHDRPTARLAWWTPEPGAPEILSGRDLRAGGTWLGLNAAGRLALVTNVRRGTSQAQHAPGTAADARPSRGRIVSQWLRDDVPLDRFWVQVALSGYEGFNLIAADFAQGECFWASSETTLPQRLERGLYGLSNAALDTPWPKVVQLKQRVRESLRSTGIEETAEQLAARLFESLADRRIAADAELPRTGVPLEWERLLSAAFIAKPDGGYGTRCSTVVITERVKRQRITHVFERSFTPNSGVALMRHSRLADWPPRYSAMAPAGGAATSLAEVADVPDSVAATPAAVKRTRSRGVIKPAPLRVRARGKTD